MAWAGRHEHISCVANGARGAVGQFKRDTQTVQRSGMRPVYRVSSHISMQGSVDGPEQRPMDNGSSSPCPPREPVPAGGRSQ
ncbi:hypothetical protein DPEC_G00242790 [Dallia pectoralis]|uniref:Uncharacterized protein n=1 Tax=Dallia pectoralis TaxID=75939 RepID=A0ACC2FV36_DALPE|nr:hypothetical protein DPEC_G00242790 [Dallia pectoralis]